MILTDKQVIKAFDFSDDPKKNPWGLKQVPYEAPLVGFIDALIDLAKKNGSKERVSTSFDYKTLDFIMKGYEVLYPQESKEFYTYMKEWRRQSTHLGVSREGDAILQHKFNLPQKVHDLIRVIFPKQEWNKKFVNNFAKRYGQFAGSERL